MSLCRGADKRRVPARYEVELRGLLRGGWQITRCSIDGVLLLVDVDAGTRAVGWILFAVSTYMQKSKDEKATSK